MEHAIQAPEHEGQKKRLDAAASNRPQQPAQVVAGRAQDGVERVTNCA